MNINHGTHKMNERNLLVFVFFDANKFSPLFLYKSSSSLTFFVSQFSVVTPFRIFGDLLFFTKFSDGRDEKKNHASMDTPVNTQLGASTGISTIDAIPNVEVRRFCFLY
jgi:hypothetical protein